VRSRALDAVVFALGRTAIGFAAWIPELVGYGLAAWLGRVWFRFAGRRRRSALKFLRIAYPDRSDAELARLGAMAAGNICKVPIDMARITRLLARGGDVLDVVDVAPVLSSLPEQKPYLALTAHLGSWEMAAVVMARLSGEAHGVARTFKNPLLQRWILANRMRAGLHIHPRRGGIRGLANAVANGAVGLQVVDQHQRLRGVAAPFFGRIASCERAAASLALRHGYPIVVGVALRVGNGFRFRMAAAETFRPESTGDKAADLLRTVTAINLRLEQLIRQAPEQYLWLHDRFRAQPDTVLPQDGPDDADEAGGG
jgi:KDO2-lipid IV(A) lauroyltransferase